MSPGKALAQSGHAYTDTLLYALDLADPSAAIYAQLKPGTKIALDGGTETDLLRLRDRLIEHDIPHALIIDRDHIELPDFDGSPIITAIGIGPISKARAKRVLSKLPLWGTSKGGAP
jgi:peptidyl-tRNA hydrolase